MRTKRQSTIDLVGTQITDLLLAQHQPHLPSAVSLDRRRVVAEGQCSKMKYRLKSFSIGFLVVVQAVVHLVWLAISQPLSRACDCRVHPRLTLTQGGGGGMFDTGPQFVFNLGGGPGFRVHQFGGNRPRRRPRDANGNAAETPQTATSMLSNLLPLLILFVIPLLSSIFSSTVPSGPSFRFESPEPPYTMQRTSPRLKVNYFVNPKDVLEMTGKKLGELDKRVENNYIQNLQYECQLENRQRTRMMEDAQGWFFPDENKMRAARNLEMRSCRKFEEYSRGGYF